MKLTNWYPIDVKPVHTGVYETQLISSVDHKTCISHGYSRWARGRWSDTCLSKLEAEHCKTAGIQRKVWRGVKGEL
jgi:hypothetical protein